MKPAQEAVRLQSGKSNRKFNLIIRWVPKSIQMSKQV